MITLHKGHWISLGGKPRHRVKVEIRRRSALLEEFKDDGEEQKRNPEAYLQCLVQDMRKEKNPTAGRYRAFISNSQNELISWLTEH